MFSHYTLIFILFAFSVCVLANAQRNNSINTFKGYYRAPIGTIKSNITLCIAHFNALCADNALINNNNRLNVSWDDGSFSTLAVRVAWIRHEARNRSRENGGLSVFGATGAGVVAAGAMRDLDAFVAIRMRDSIDLCNATVANATAAGNRNSNRQEDKILGDVILKMGEKDVSVRSLWRYCTGTAEVRFAIDSYGRRNLTSLMATLNDCSG